MNKTLAELRADVRAALSEGSRRFFTDDNVTRWLNDAQDFVVAEELLASNGVWWGTFVPNAWWYQLPEDVIIPKRLYGTLSTNQEYRVDCIEKDQLDAITRLSRRNTTSNIVSSVAYGRTEYGMTIEIYPAVSTWSRFRIEGTRRMKHLVDELDVTECPIGLTHILVHYALWQAKKKDEEVQQADQWERQVQRDVAEVRARRMREIASDAYPRVRPRKRLGRFWP